MARASDPMAVVDERARVLGVRGERVSIPAAGPAVEHGVCIGGGCSAESFRRRVAPGGPSCVGEEVRRRFFFLFFYKLELPHHVKLPRIR